MELKEEFFRLVHRGEPAYLKRQRESIEGKELYLTGILLFRGHGDGVSSLICKLTDSEWSHVGVHITSSADTSAEEFCFESTGSIGEVLSGMHPQVQIHTLQDVLDSYKGNVGLRKLVSKDKIEVTEFVQAWLGLPYEKRPLELLRAVNASNKKEDSESLFCSEMVALLLKKLELLPEDKLADNYTPKDFVDIQLEGPVLTGIEMLSQYSEKTHKSCCLLM